MNCPNCNSENLKIARTRVVKNGIKRSRLCNDCGHKFTTIEMLESEVEFVDQLPSESNAEPQTQTESEKPTVSVDPETFRKQMRAINRKLNVIAKYLGALNEDKIKIPNKSKVKKYEEDYKREFMGVEVPEPEDVHAWALLIASLGDN